MYRLLGPCPPKMYHHLDCNQALPRKQQYTSATGAAPLSQLQIRIQQRCLEPQLLPFSYVSSYAYPLSPKEQPLQSHAPLAPHYHCHHHHRHLPRRRRVHHPAHGSCCGGYIQVYLSCFALLKHNSNPHQPPAECASGIPVRAFLKPSSFLPPNCESNKLATQDHYPIPGCHYCHSQGSGFCAQLLRLNSLSLFEIITSFPSTQLFSVDVESSVLHVGELQSWRLALVNRRMLLVCQLVDVVGSFFW